MNETSLESLTEEYLLLLLSDSNLPTGGFVASSGLESFIQHGYLPTTTTSSLPRNPMTVTGGGGGGGDGKQQHDVNNERETGLVEFVEKSLNNYSNLNSPLLVRSHRIMERYQQQRQQQQTTETISKERREGFSSEEKRRREEERQVIEALLEVDRLCEDMILNQVSKRASIAQGNALLSLYSRALAPTTTTTTITDRSNVSGVVETIRREIRKGESGGWRGHQSTSFGIVMAAVGLSLHRSLHLFLFLHARSILSSAVRLNVIGPYSAHRLLLWDIRKLVEEATVKVQTQISSSLTTTTTFEADDRTRRRNDVMDTKEDSEGDERIRTRDWWDDNPEWSFLTTKEEEEKENSVTWKKQEPVSTWPLGEIVASRHDQLFTKVFNS